MASSDSSPGANRLTVVVDAVHRHFLWLLLASYLLAALLPGPGLAIREFSLGDDLTASMLLLATLLFSASAVVRGSQIRGLIQRPGILLLGLLAVWLVPSLFVSALGWILPWLMGNSLAGGMLVGLAIVAAMPVANSSVAWAQNARGNVVLGLGLIILTIVLCPLATPQMLNFMGLSLSGQETEQCAELVRKFSGIFFIIWVILPASAGTLFNVLAGPERVDRARGLLRLVSAIALLTLNYANAALALPRVLEEEGATTLIVAGGLAVSLSLIGIVSAWVLSHLLDLGLASRASLTFGFSMKHTGLALVLAGEVLQEEPRVILMIVMATLLQHVVAGAANWFLDRHQR
ncbi:MAG: bile acid:sodium symporter [Pirellulales bacterium]|nr:bile acid:sodium symporter [Pirellulales bacterium]